MNTFMAGMGIVLLLSGIVNVTNRAADGPIALVVGIGLIFVLLIQAKQAASDVATISAAIRKALA